MQLSRSDVILLAGGQGTRMRNVLPDGLPKCLSDVQGIPFLSILLDHISPFFREARFLIAGGYGWNLLNRYLTENSIAKRSILAFREPEPLGTAGAISWLVKQVNFSDPFWIINADTLCDLDYGEMLAYHEASNSVITVACDGEFRHVGASVASRRFVDLIPRVDAKVDMAEVFTLLGQRHEPVGWFMTDAPFYDIGDETGLTKFRELAKSLFPKGGEGRMSDNRKESLPR